MSDRTCPSVERLTEYCLGKLAVPEFDLLERHVDECHSCQDTVDKLDLGGDTFIANLREKPGAEPPPADPHTSEPALQAALAAARKPPATKLPVAKAIPQPAPASPPTLAVKKWTEGAQPQSVDDFLSCVVTSQLLDVAAAREFLRSLPADKAATDAKSAAVAFVNAGKLTAFQARALYQGKCQHLVVAEREILDLLGKGGMGNVYKARHRRLDRIEALKLISPKKLDAPEAKQRFAREARAAAKLNHPNVVTTYDAGESGGLHFLAMEFIDGSDLARIVKERGPLSVEQAVSCTLQAAAGLQCAHTAGIVHRDIKPHNLLLDPQGKVKILDMGLARINDTLAADAAKEGLTQSGQIMGTIDFMSPEQTLDVHTVGPASDVYSLGCTLYYLLTSKTPFDGDSFGQKMMAHHHQPIPSLTAARAEVPAALDAVFQKMLAKKVEDRYSAMSEVIAALEKLGSASSTPVPLVPGRSAVNEGLDSFLSRQAVSQDMPQPHVNAAQLAPTLVSTKPTPKLRSRRISPAILAGVALLAAIVGVVAYLQVFTIRTPYGDVEVSIAPEYADQVQVIITGGGKTIAVDKADDWKIKLAEGKYDVSLDPASKAKFTLDKQSVSVTEQKKEVVKVTLASVPAPNHFLTPPENMVSNAPGAEPSRPTYVHKDAKWNAATGSWYYIHPEPMTYHEAAKLATASSALPVIIESKEENEFVYHLSRIYEKRPGVWLGYVKGKDGSLQTVNGSPAPFENWHSNEGKLSGEKYVYMMWGGKHADSYADTIKARACLEWKPPMLLAFDGDSYIDIPNFKYDGSHPLTFEARISDWMPPKNNSHPVFQSTFVDGDNHFGSSISFVGFGLDLSKSNTAIHIGSSAKPGLVLPSSSRPRSETLIDLTVVFDGEKRAIFRDGKRVHNADFSFGSKEPPKYTESRARLGGHASSDAQRGSGFRGYLQHVRISKIARYQGNHVPPETLEADADTLLLYRFNQPVGAAAKDLSPNKLDGKIVGAKSVPESDTLKSVKQSPPPAKDLMLAFDGDDYIDIPNFKYDGSHPLTFEARLADWLPGKEMWHPVFHSTYYAQDGHYSTWISLIGHKIDFTKMTNEIHVGSSSRPGWILPSSPRPRSETMIDLAVVFDGQKRSIFRDGKPVHNDEFTLGAKSVPKDHGVRARIGANVDAPADSKAGYRGFIQQVRISKTARYKGTYVPPTVLESDDDTMLLYRFDQDTGKVAKDISPNKLDGQIVGAEWVSADVIKPPAVEVQPKTLAAGQWHNVLTQVNPEFDTFRGTWKKVEQGYEGTGQHAALLIPAEVPPGKSYDAKLKFRFLTRTQELGIVCPVGMGGGVKVTLNHHETKKSGLSYVRGQFPGQPENDSTCIAHALQPNKTHELEIAVKNSVTTVDISAKVDGNLLFDWRGRYDELSMHTSGKLGHPRCLGLVLQERADNGVIVEDFQLRCADAPLSLLATGPTTPEHAAAQHFHKLGAVLGIEDADGSWKHDPKILPFREKFSVQYLDVGGTQVTDDDMKHILSLPDLYQVHLYDTNLGDPTFELLGRLPKLRLISSSPKNRRLTDVGVAALKPLGAQLEELRLFNSPNVTSAGIIALGNLPNVRTVDLTATQCDEEMLTAVSRWPQLSTLLIGGLTLRRSHVEILAKFPNLGRLYTDGGRVNDADLQFLRENLPRCWIRSGPKVFNCQFKLPGTDLLADLDPIKPPLAPHWIEAGGLSTHKCENAEIELKSNLPAEYDLHLVISRHSSWPWAVLLPLADGRQLRIAMERDTGRKIAGSERGVFEGKLSLPSGKEGPVGVKVDHFIERNWTHEAPSQVTIQVRKDDVRIWSEQELACRISGDFRNLPTPAPTDQPTVLQLKAGKGFYDQSFRLHQAHLDVSPPALKHINAKPVPKS